MEIRTAKVNLSAAGGTAAPGSLTAKISLPISWLRQMGVSEEDRSLELAFDGDTIRISRPVDLSEFIRRSKAAGHKIFLLTYYDRQTVCSRIAADFSEHSIRVENETDDPVRTAFGLRKLPTWDDFLFFLEERCVPRERDGLRYYLEALGLSEYDPFEIVLRTGGRMAEDHQWIQVEII